MDRESLAFLSVLNGLDQEGVEQPFTLSQIREYAKKEGIDLYLTPNLLERTLVYLIREGHIDVDSADGKTVVYLSTGRRLYLPGRDISSWEPVEDHPPHPPIFGGKTYSEACEMALDYIEEMEAARLRRRRRRKSSGLEG